MLTRVRWLLATLLALTAVSSAWPCNVPVFRYALERWQPDDYTVTVFHRGPLTPEQKQRVEQLRKLDRDEGGRISLHIEEVDVSSPLDKPIEALWKAQKDPTLPWVVVQEPNPEEGAAWWAGPLGDESAFGKVIDSPVRRQIAQRLQQGTAIVWLLVESGDAKADAASAELLEKLSAKLMKELKLPDGIGEGDSVLLSPVPLRISFATLRVSRTDPEEKPFVALLAHLFPDVAKGGPVAVPIFGRGRALDGVGGEDFTAENLEQAALFLAGRCSCQVKRLNPGIDLLTSANWETIFEENTEDPAKKTHEVPLVAFPEGTTPEPDPEPMCVVQPESRWLQSRVVWISVGGAGVGLLAGTALILLLTRRGGA